MKPISDERGNKMYGYSMYDLQKMVGLQQQQIRSLNQLIRWKKIQVAIATAAMAFMVYLVIWIDYNNVLTRLISGG